MAVLMLEEGRLNDPFSLLGRRTTPQGPVVRAFVPGALSVAIICRQNERVLATLSPEGQGGAFSGILSLSPRTL